MGGHLFVALHSVDMYTLGVALGFMMMKLFFAICYLLEDEVAC